MNFCHYKITHTTRAFFLKLQVRFQKCGSPLAMLGLILAAGPGPSPTPQIFSWRSMRKRWPCNESE